MPIKTGAYVGATADELRANTTADKAAGAVSQKALFKRRGTIELTDEALTLSTWGDAGSLTLRREDIRSATTAFTELYGRFIGGLLNAGKPLILDTAAAGEIYLLIDRKELMETTKDREWQQAIEEWLAARA
ncbi:MAG: hypothetical protein ACTHOE_01010 [Conexibacter sp.]